MTHRMPTTSPRLVAIQEIDDDDRGFFVGVDHVCDVFGDDGVAVPELDADEYDCSHREYSSQDDG